MPKILNLCLRENDFGSYIIKTFSIIGILKVETSDYNIVSKKSLDQN